MRKTGLATACAALLGGAGPAVGAAAWETPPMFGSSSFSLSPQSVGMMISSAHAGMNLGMWRNYTRQALLPDFSERFGFRVVMDLGLLASHEHLLMPGFAQVWDAPEPSTRLSLDFSAGYVAESPLSSRLSNDWLEINGSGVAIGRVLFAPGLSRELSDGSSIGVAAVFANQHYASWGMGAHLADDVALAHMGRLPSSEEHSAGTGVRLAFNSELAPGIELDAAYQSRINMDAFQNYRGVYSEPGDFDIPASANVGIVVKSGRRSSISLGIQRVLYSDVNTFTTASLPDRFLSLLGDGGSPEFDWEDLTIFSLGWNWQSSELWDWRVQYSTRQQPTPSSEILNRALASEIADRNVTLGFSRRTGRNSRVDFAASYAPSEYFLGSSSAFVRSPDLRDDQFEFEFRLIWDF